MRNLLLILFAVFLTNCKSDDNTNTTYDREIFEILAVGAFTAVLAAVPVVLEGVVLEATFFAAATAVEAVAVVFSAALVLAEVCSLDAALTPAVLLVLLVVAMPYTPKNH